MVRTKFPGLLLAVALFWIISSSLTDVASAQKPSTGIQTVSRTKIIREAQTLDRLIEADLNRHKIEPNPKTDDATFVRRLYLDIVGRIPTATETTTFLQSDDPKKRGNLIDELLDSPGATSTSLNWWADLLRAKTRLGNNLSGEPYIHWLKESIIDDKPYDVMVAELLASEGPAHKEGSGATGYYLRDRGMPLDNMANTMRLFLGTRIECAQCHNHPYESFTQKQFFEMAAFSGGLKYNNQEVEALGTIRKQLSEMGSTTNEDGKLDQATLRAAVRLVQPMTYGVSGNGTGKVRLPEDYQYDDGSPKDVVKAKTLFGKRADLKFVDEPNERRKRGKRRAREPRKSARPRKAPPIDSRSALAEWLTAPENPRFTTVIANRLWKLCMGRGQIEPVDDLKSDSKASNPRLMVQLEKLMIDLSYDLRQFRRVLYSTEAYQREASSYAPGLGEKYHFEGPLLRRMGAEQIWDSMLTLAVQDIDSKIKPPGQRAASVYQQYEELRDLPLAEVRQQAEARSLRYKDPEAFREMMGTQAKKRRQEDSKNTRERRKHRMNLQRKLKLARRQKNKENEESILAELDEMRDDDLVKNRERSMRGMVRASDLPSPAPPGHFLRQFGQSDRELIDGSHQDASIPQALNLLNGFVETRILNNRFSTLIVDMRNAKEPATKIRTAYLAILNREPLEEELNLWLEDLKFEGTDIYQDVIWTLLNTHEFLFIQ